MPAAQPVREIRPAHELPELPYDDDALEPVISAKTLALHHGKHHKAYVDRVNELTKGTELAQLALDELVVKTANSSPHSELFNNAAQAWNHDFYWRSLTPEKGDHLSPALGALVKSGFGGLTALKDQLAQAAVKQFGSGWAWLALEGGKLKVMSTGDAENPLVTGLTPLLTIDVWEHAYYVDYQNRRPEYVRAVVETLLNWKFASANLEAAGG
ncbi:MAG: superoxide dismutase [Gammaproteobacteria bacterium]|nr:superoxide dismutase [Gammaproteobacteria bacterium]